MELSAGELDRMNSFSISKGPEQKDASLNFLNQSTVDVNDVSQMSGMETDASLKFLDRSITENNKLIDATDKGQVARNWDIPHFKMMLRVNGPLQRLYERVCFGKYPLGLAVRNKVKAPGTGFAVDPQH